METVITGLKDDDITTVLTRPQSVHRPSFRLDTDTADDDTDATDDTDGTDDSDAADDTDATDDADGTDA